MYLLVKLVLGAMIVRLSDQFVFPENDQQEERKLISGHDITSIGRDGQRVIGELMKTNEVIQDKSDSSMNLIDDQYFCQNGTQFCTDPVTYPSKAIRKALRKQKRIINSMFDKDLYRLRMRSGFDLIHGGENVCGMTSSHIMPKAAKNKKGQFKFLVNGGEGTEDYIQLVKISQCLGEGEVCGKGKIFTREVTECRQEYTDHKLVALDEEGKQLVVDTFSFPSCCSCFMQTGLEL